MYLKFKYEREEGTLDLLISPCRLHMREMRRYGFDQRLLFPRKVDCEYLAQFTYEHVMYRKLRIYVGDDQAAYKLVFNLQKDLDRLWSELTEFIGRKESNGSFLEFSILHNMEASENPLADDLQDAAPNISSLVSSTAKDKTEIN